MKKFIYFSILLFTCSCNPALQFRLSRKDFTYTKYEPYPKLDSILNVDGYFYRELRYDSTSIEGEDDIREYGRIRTGHAVIMFYRDGTIAITGGTIGVPGEEVEALQNYLSDNSIKGRRTVAWGRFYLFGDTIKSQFVYPYGWWGTRIYEQHFLIENKNEIRRIKSIDYHAIQMAKKAANSPFVLLKIFPLSEEAKYAGEEMIQSPPFHFVPFPERVDSAHWVKKKRWFWDKEHKYMRKE